MQKLTCNFQEKCFFRARTVVCAHASFLVAFCFSCNCRWTRYDLQQTVPYLGLKKSGQHIQSVAYTLIYNHIEKITDSPLLIYIPLRRWADLVTVSTVSDSWSWIQPKFVQLWHVTCKYFTYVHDYSCIQWPPMIFWALPVWWFQILWVFRGLNHQGHPCAGCRCQDWGAVGAELSVQGWSHPWISWMNRGT